MITKQQYEQIPENERRNATLEGVAFYASVHTPNLSAQRLFGVEPVFKITLGLDKPEMLEKAESLGLLVKPADAYVPYPHVVVKARVKEGKSEKDVKPKVVDSLQKDVPENILIGNNSRVIIKFLTYWHLASHKFGVGTYLSKVQIKELVKYVPQDKDDGFVSDGSGFKIEDFDELADSLPFETEEATSVEQPPKEVKKGAKAKLDPSLFDA